MRWQACSSQTAPPAASPTPPPTQGVVYRLSTGLAALPVAPVGLVATAGHFQAPLSWLRSAGATSYNVYRGTSAGRRERNPIRLSDIDLLRQFKLDAWDDILLHRSRLQHRRHRLQIRRGVGDTISTVSRRRRSGACAIVECFPAAFPLNTSRWKFLPYQTVGASIPFRKVSYPKVLLLPQKELLAHVITIHA